MSKFRNLIESILQEAKQVGNLYHATNLNSLKRILDSDQMISNAYSTGTSGGISTSRNKTFFYKAPVSIILDGDKLSENYKLVPFSMWGSMGLEPEKGEERFYKAEYETVIIPNNLPKDFNPDEDDLDYIIPNIHKYIKGIVVLPNLFASKELTAQLKSILEEYPYPIYNVNGQQLDINKADSYYNDLAPYLKDKPLNRREENWANHISDADELEKSQDDIINKAIEKDTGKTIDALWKENPEHLSHLRDEYEHKFFTGLQDNIWHRFNKND